MLSALQTARTALKCRVQQSIVCGPAIKPPGSLEVPADLFKQAPVSFQRRIHLLVNEILIGDHDCDKELLMAKGILIHKDEDIAILDHYRPIALLNTIYQLSMIIITSRLRQLSENYAVVEGSQYGFRAHRGVQMVVGPKCPLGTTTGNEREWHSDQNRSGL